MSVPSGGVGKGGPGCSESLGTGSGPSGRRPACACCSTLSRSAVISAVPLVPIDDPRAGASLTVSSPLQIGGQEKVPPILAPEIGPHTVQVLRTAGIAAAGIERLPQAGAIAPACPEAP